MDSSTDNDKSHDTASASLAIAETAASVSITNGSSEPSSSVLPSPLYPSPPISSKHVIAVDLDEVLGQFVPQLILYHNHHYSSNYTIKDIHSYHFSDVEGFGTEQEARQKVLKFFTSHYFVNMPPIIGALQVLSRYRLYFDYIVVTARETDLETATRTWLDQHYPGLFTAVLFGNHYGQGHQRTKADMCQSINAIALIDDSAIHAAAVSKVIDHIILFDHRGEYGWNKGKKEFDHLPDNVHRLTSWDEIEQYFGILVKQYYP